MRDQGVLHERKLVGSGAHVVEQRGRHIGIDTSPLDPRRGFNGRLALVE